MVHIFEQRVYYSDTDAYGVVWHGSYIRWMEAARVEFCSACGIDLTDLMSKDIIIPVTNINIRYKASAKLDEKLIIETCVSKISPITVIFNQVIKNKLTGTVYTIAEVEVVAVHNDGKIYRRLPEALKINLGRSIECNV